MSCERRQLAVVDDASSVHVYRLADQALQWQENGASSVAWNTAFEEMVCFSGGRGWGDLRCNMRSGRSLAMQCGRYGLRVWSLPAASASPAVAPAAAVPQGCRVHSCRAAPQHAPPLPAGNSQLSTKTGRFALLRQRLQGFVVGLSGSKLFCLHFVSMQTLDLPQSASMHRYLAISDWGMAYKVRHETAT